MDTSGKVTGSYTGQRFFLSVPNFFIHKELRETEPGSSIRNLGQSSDCEVKYARPWAPEYGNPGSAVHEIWPRFAPQLRPASPCRTHPATAFSASVPVIRNEPSAVMPKPVRQGAVVGRRSTARASSPKLGV